MQGAKLLYMKLILPTLKKHESVIDQYVQLGEHRMRKSLAHLVRLTGCWSQLRQTRNHPVCTCLHCSRDALKQVDVCRFESTAVCIVQGITQQGTSSQSSTFPSPGRLESLTQTHNRFSSAATVPQQDVESKPNVTKAS